MRLLVVLASFVLLTATASAQPCVPEKALLYSSLANNLINIDKTSDNESKAARYAALAVQMDQACMQKATSVKNHGTYYLSMAYNLAIAATAEESLGQHAHAVTFANLATKIWRDIVAEPAYPNDIRASAQKQLNATK